MDKKNWMGLIVGLNRLECYETLYFLYDTVHPTGVHMTVSLTS